MRGHQVIVMTLLECLGDLREQLKAAERDRDVRLAEVRRDIAAVERTLVLLKGANDATHH